ncbi:MAG: hypothetical protein HN392_07140 [Anaerolineae bacterium]|jgi:predicted thioesterase|nr:hypothetical protein [Anaerolineae bacterium]MBT7075927.1 hypothetical protein [Anaerolineae bacterium]MBT7783108.1 hypothetical protein [Anaerolineae bacterium]
MKLNISKGDKLKEVFQVKPKDCISEIDKRLPDLLGTYIIVKWMEIISAKLAHNSLDDKYITVGQNINITHTGMVAKGESVTIKSVFIQQAKRKLNFKITLRLRDEIIAEAEHTRIIIPKRIIQRQMKNEKR